MNKELHVAAETGGPSPDLSTRKTHTPGPWHYVALPSGGYEICIENGAWLMVCTSASNPTDAEREEDEANVRLAAAAPELLETATALLFVVRALANELGIDPETTEFNFTANGLPVASVNLATAYERADSTIAKATGATS